MYSGFQLCGDLEPKMRRIRLRRYQSDQFEELHHEHIPAHRLSDGNCIEMMKALVLRFSEAGPERIVRSYLNQRGREPYAEDPFQIVVEYREPGVLRKHCGTNVQAWSDTVIKPDPFRNTSSRPRPEGHQ